MEKRNAIEEILKSGTRRHQEKAILDILEEATDSELDLLVGGLDLSRLLQAMDDRPTGPRNYTATLELLVQKRVAALSPRSRAHLVDALQRGRTHGQAEKAIRDLFLATRGPGLTDLKDAVDTGADHRDLLQLIFSDIDDAKIRTEILNHIKEASPKPDGSRRKVLSDIDDTFYANWKDKRFPAKTIYPGVRAFYRALAKPDWSAPGRRSHVTFITARPQERLGLVEGLTHKHLREMELEEVTILTGSFKNLHSNEAIAEKKVENFKRYARVFPEYEFIFVGDSGQGDAILAREMKKAHPERVRATFIHDVVETPPKKRAQWKGDGVHFFDSYAMASSLARELGLMDDEGLVRVGRETVEDFRGIAFQDPAQKAARIGELVRDLSALRKKLPAPSAQQIPAF
jgi:hypothetical protein